jgi:hypothetical protein
LKRWSQQIVDPARRRGRGHSCLTKQKRKNISFLSHTFIYRRLFYPHLERVFFFLEEEEEEERERHERVVLLPPPPLPLLLLMDSGCP